MYPKKIYVIILSATLFMSSCQKLITDPGGASVLTQTTDNVVHWGNNYDDKGLAVVQTADGGYGVVGTEYHPVFQEQLMLVKFDSNMDYTDTLSFGGTKENIADSSNQKAQNLQQTIDGGYIFVGSTMNTDFNYDMWVVKYGPDLTTPIWEKTISGTDYYNYTYQNTEESIDESGKYNDYGNSIQQTEDGSYIVCGTIYDGNDNDIALWKIDLNDATDSLTLVYGENRDNGTCSNTTYQDSTNCVTASETWNKTLSITDNGTSDVGNYAQQTNDGGYIIVGSSYSENTSYDIRLIKLKADFEIEFNKTYEIGSSYNDDEGIFVQQTSDNGYVIVGNYGGVGEGQVFILKTNYLGVRTTSQYYGSSQHPDIAACVRQTNDNGFIMVGSKYSQSSTMEDVWVVKFSHDLSPEWEQTFGGDLSDFGTSINQTSDGGYIITGYSYSYPADRNKQSEVILIKLDADGLPEKKCIQCLDN